jgi:short-subunit dehydrogenase
MQQHQKRIVIIGATSAIAEHCARLWINENELDVTLVGRNPEKIERIAADLRVRSPQSVIRVIEADFVDPLRIRQRVDAIIAQGAVDTVLIAHGLLPDQAVCQQDLSVCDQALSINANSPVLFAEAFAAHMEKANHGTLALIGSVAGDRGRKSNYVYGAAKGLVDRYAQGLQHRFANTHVKVVLIKPGPTDTPMTAHLKQQGSRLAKVEHVADGIVKGVKRGQTVVYVPGKWKLIMAIIRHLPRFIFNKLEI